MVPNLEIEFSVAEAPDTVPLQETKTKEETFHGVFNPVGQEIIGEIYCYDKFELILEMKIDKLALKVQDLSGRSGQHIVKIFCII